MKLYYLEVVTSDIDALVRPTSIRTAFHSRC